MRGSKKAGPVKKRIMRGGGTAAKKAGPVKKLRGGGMTTKKMRSGGRNLRDEEARVIGVQDNAADEMRRVKARRPHDAAERRDKKSQESRVGSRERNARDEMTRLRGEAVGMGMKTGGKTVKKFMGGGMDAGINASLGRMNSGINKRVAAMPKQGAPSLRRRGPMPSVSAEKSGARAGLAAQEAARRAATGRAKGGKTVKKMATGSQTKSDRQDESLGMRDGKESTKTQSYTSRRNESNATRRSTPRAPAPKPSSARQMSMLIPQHKRMAMGENVLTGKMINKADGGKIERTKAPNRAPATTGVNLNMGAPKTRRTTARGMGAATRGGNFTENT